MEEYVPYFLVQWEDRFMSVIMTRDVVFPKKDKATYFEGELIKAVFKKKTYNAVICEIHPNRKYLQQQAKLPPKYYYSVMVESTKTNGTLSTPQRSDTGMTEKSDTAAKEVKNMAAFFSISQTGNVKTSEITDTATKVIKDAGKSAAFLSTPKMHMGNVEKPDTVTQDEGKSAFLSTPQPGNVETSEKTDTGIKVFNVEGKSDSRNSPSVGKRSYTDDRSNELREDLKSLRRKIKRLEERVGELEKNGDDSTDGLAVVQHLDDSDVQKVFFTLALNIFTEEELISSSRTGKRTNKCSDGVPRPPLDNEKLRKLEALVMRKTKISRDLFNKKLENLQKTLRQKKKN